MVLPFSMGSRRALCWILAGLLLGIAGRVQGAVNYQREVRRILSNHCYQCHGPDETTRKASLRLDRESGAVIESGGSAISREAPETSPLLERIHAEDPEDIMPPPETNKPLSAEQRAILSQWVREGAEWGEHWAYRAPARPRLPEWDGDAGVRHPIDRFVRHRLGEVGVSPAPAADTATLVRRLSLDLLGLPPEPEAVDGVLSDPDSLAVERWIDRLLGSHHYGERMAMYWFDLVRFANTTGIHADNVWHVNPYRNWVIEALNANMPFDQFTREQLAGDLMPDASEDQRIAATYNRLNLSTREGGSQAKEFLAKYMADRVRNASSVWLASTLGCAECHDHKFDPLSTKEFYQMGAFFADIEQVGVYGSDFPPYLSLPTPTQETELKRLTKELDEARAALNAVTPERVAALATWETERLADADQEVAWDAWRSVGPFVAPDLDTAHKEKWGPESDTAVGKEYGEAGLRWVAQTEWDDGQVIELPGETGATYVHREVVLERATDLRLFVGSDDGVRVWWNEKRVLDRKSERPVKVDQDAFTVSGKEGTNTLLMKISNVGSTHGFSFRSRLEPVPPAIEKLFRIAAEERNESDREKIWNHFRAEAPFLAEERAERDRLDKSRKALEKAIEKTLATVAVMPAVTRVLPRGNWMDESGEVVQPGVPTVMGEGLPESDSAATRADLADWLVQRSHPLTARVFVNRLWQLFFGTGLAEAVDDFGAQGDVPSHPELLDWLAVEFMDSGWDIKHMVRLIVTSQTYQQSSDPRPELEGRDPFNRLVARQNRYRVDAETVRDIALSVSGLLNRRVGGYESARPYQPSGYYRHLNFPKRTYQSDDNPDQYRRGVYMHWQRQYLHPALRAFDAPTREECVARRPRSNTPLAALVLMNDPTIIEAARVFAASILAEPDVDEGARLRLAFRRALSRWPTERELAVLRELLAEQRAQFVARPESASEFLEIGLSEVDAVSESDELAAWTVVTRTLLNLHETILRR